jgi:molybdopterin converting factor small subunit
MITIELKLFAMFREYLKKDALVLQVPSNLPVSEIIKVLQDQKYLSLAQKIPPLRFAVNEEFVSSHYALQDGDVLCLVPPVTGGSHDHA